MTHSSGASLGFLRCGLSREYFDEKRV